MGFHSPVPIRFVLAPGLGAQDPRPPSETVAAVLAGRTCCQPAESVRNCRFAVGSDLSFEITDVGRTSAGISKWTCALPQRRGTSSVTGRGGLQMPMGPRFHSSSTGKKKSTLPQWTLSTSQVYSGKRRNLPTQ